ncbi:MAG: hypothetical protein WAZ18_00980 [Alphaproteobacteria bacterium]
MSLPTSTSEDMNLLATYIPSNHITPELLDKLANPFNPFPTYLYTDTTTLETILKPAARRIVNAMNATCPVAEDLYRGSLELSPNLRKAAGLDR